MEWITFFTVFPTGWYGCGCGYWRGRLGVISAAIFSHEETDLLKFDIGGRGQHSDHETRGDEAWHVMMGGWCDPGPHMSGWQGWPHHIRDSEIDDLQWSVFPSCPKWSASAALINLFSFGWFCLISNGGSLHWEHTEIRIKLDLLTFYKIGPPAQHLSSLACSKTSIY